MSGEHNTPVGTPVVIAPGKVFLVGEYAVLEEGSAVQAAITRYAKAQFLPRTDTMQPLVSEIIKRIRAELGEVSAALPPGSVLVSTDDFRRESPISGLGSSAAIAVASVGAVLESLGLAIESRKRQIFAIADTGRRATQRNVGSGADTAAATYGGLIRITRPKGSSIQVAPLQAPSCLHLVLFSAGASVSPHLIVDGVQRYARRNPVNFSRATDRLRESAQAFVEAVSAGRAEAAVDAAGLYGDELQRLCSAAGVPIMTSAFSRAAGLAKEFGGIAKPTGAGNGEIGVALFPMQESARWFRRSCTDPLVAMDGGVDTLGVRCRLFENDVEIDLSESDPAATPSPEVEVAATQVASTRGDLDLLGQVESRQTSLDLHSPFEPWLSTDRVPSLRKRAVPKGAVVLAVVISLGLVLALALQRYNLTRSAPGLPAEARSPEQTLPRAAPSGAYESTTAKASAAGTQASEPSEVAVPSQEDRIGPQGTTTAARPGASGKAVNPGHIAKHPVRSASDDFVPEPPKPAAQEPPATESAASAPQRTIRAGRLSTDDF